MQVSSPLLEKEKIKLIETIKTKRIAKLYRQKNRHLEKLVKQEFGNIEEISLYEGCESGLKFFYPMKTGTAGYYEQLQQDFNRYYLDDKDEYNFAARFITEHDRVLEIGAGKGSFTKHIEFNEYIGLEYNDRAIVHAAQQGINLHNKSIEAYANNPNNRAKHSVVVSFQVLEHIANPVQFVESALKCLQKKGLLIISVPAEDSFISTSINDTLNLPPHHVTRWSDRALTTLGNKFNLETVAIEHDRLGLSTEYHKKWYLKCIVQSALMNFLGINRKLVDTSPLTRFIGKFAAAVGLFLATGFQEDRLMPNGHTVTAVYRKL
jgi:2-polyprenyl-3-methyl-5-hydroxy-6-metoxy-1,4-benzoquinol methylase